MRRVRDFYGRVVQVNDVVCFDVKTTHINEWAVFRVVSILDDDHVRVEKLEREYEMTVRTDGVVVVGQYKNHDTAKMLP
jgi:hypothetical protein